MKTNNRQLPSTVLLTLSLMALLLGGCRDRRGQETPEEVAVTAIPTATVVTVSAMPTFTPTNVPDTPTPVPTDTPVPPPTAVPTVEDKRVTINSQVGANLRAGPGTVYAVVGFLAQGEKVAAIAQNRDGQWIQLENGWVFHNLLDGIPADLPLSRSIPSPPTSTPVPPTATATPAPSTATPTPSPTPRLGEFGKSITFNNEHRAEDGLIIKLSKTIYGSTEEDVIRDYIEIKQGENCRDCLALELEIRKGDGTNPNEYVVQEDFMLVKGNLEVKDRQVDCNLGDRGPGCLIDLDLGNPDVRKPQVNCSGSPMSRILFKRPGKRDITSSEDATVVHLCFEDIEDSKSEIVETYRLAYTHAWIAPADPTPTPSSRTDTRVFSVPNEEKRKEWKWILYFKLG